MHVYRARLGQVLLCVSLAICVAIYSPSLNADTGKVVLVAAKGSEVSQLSMRDIRRLYLGLKPSSGDKIGNAVINKQSAATYDAFLKNVMRLTESSYTRKRVKAIFMRGKQEITELTSLEELNQYLLNNRGDVSFVQTSSLEQMRDIEVIQVLW